MRPSLSIITINYNNVKGLEKTIESVINQTFIDYEYIVIDANSTDGSKEIIEKYADKITYWVSEPDKGIYNGMNKGIGLAKGEYCLFLNSGDRLINTNVLLHIFKMNYSQDIVYFDIKTDKGIIKYPRKLNFNLFFTGTICHQATLIKLSLFEEMGNYNEEIKIVADWEFFCKAILLNKEFKKGKEILSYYDLTGISSDKNIIVDIIKEREIVLKKLFPLMYDDYIELQKLKTELYIIKPEYLRYKNAKLVQLVEKFQQSFIYKFLRK